MFKAVYQNPKSKKLYAFLDVEKDGQKETKILTVFDNHNRWEGSEFKVDKKGRAYKVLDVEIGKTKNGFEVFKTVNAGKDAVK